jgi:hypothetical protein
MGCAYCLPTGFIGADEGGKGHEACVSHESCDLANPADVLCAVLWGEPEVGVESVTDVVAVKGVCGTAVGNKSSFNGVGDR